MTYLVLNIIFFVPILAIAAWAYRTRRRQLPSRRAVGITLIVLLAATAVFDNVLIGIGIVDYNPDLILGVRLALAPVEDFAYTVGACILLPALWALIPGRTDRHAAEPPPSTAASTTTP
ncbi:lycopene cyclase domain-containing protein [Arthrobacter sp. CAN_C5]|uniref:lycopene cyclase domain-containing protein n=1 Tax=Arthrobacter sp. CAN_C5 TaxID=2760706 RepID=UPI001AE3D8E4|nr:lycopene cyclase domain-containing protein [Arthrobacter sp. CAN_C5]MBP2215272.1 lycopene cyclase domain-containing protein [Arthrobacter sp. CAN_C5]